MHYQKILVVCTGNICRSPTAEQIFKQHLPGLFVISAGTAALTGRSVDKKALLSAKRHNIDLAGHQVRQLTVQMCEFADLILVMEEQHIKAVTNICPSARKKTLLLGEWTTFRNIADPYTKSQDIFDYAYQQIAEACGTWITKLTT